MKQLMQIRSWNVFLPLAVVGLAWMAVLQILWSDWMIDPQYGYGFLVPLLVLGLLWKRCDDLPSPAISGSIGFRCAAGIALFSALILGAVIPLAEANPDWRVLGVIASFAALGITLVVIFQLGGGGLA